MFVCRQYCCSSQMRVCFCWQWIAVTIKYYMNIKIHVLCFQMFYILIPQITIWQFRSHWTLDIKVSPTVTTFLDRVFGVTAFRVKCVQRVDFVGFRTRPSLKSDESSGVSSKWNCAFVSSCRWAKIVSQPNSTKGFICTLSLFTFTPSWSHVNERIWSFFIDISLKQTPSNFLCI